MSMDLFSIKTIKELLKQEEQKPKKSLGQNFLISKDVLARILGAAELSWTDTVLEIGPGIGTLTRGLAQSAKQVIAVEKDPAMVEILKETTKDLPILDPQARWRADRAGPELPRHGETRS